MSCFLLFLGRKFSDQILVSSQEDRYIDMPNNQNLMIDALDRHSSKFGILAFVSIAYGAWKIYDNVDDIFDYTFCYKSFLVCATLVARNYAKSSYRSNYESETCLYASCTILLYDFLEWVLEPPKVPYSHHLLVSSKKV
eukprot:TRINITY_DN3539_c0_g1_i1.p2 TRINITY_DN3539_c0_g1~~TRINITY_DN3539_c0_g1_i1.p2  ORF type:complete len:139 (+),score=17.61 TRINITY_DN3539_c0_g1_i1:542-958(+)